MGAKKSFRKLARYVQRLLHARSRRETAIKQMLTLIVCRSDAQAVVSLLMTMSRRRDDRQSMKVEGSRAPLATTYIAQTVKMTFYSDWAFPRPRARSFGKTGLNQAAACTPISYYVSFISVFDWKFEYKQSKSTDDESCHY